MVAPDCGGGVHLLALRWAGDPALQTKSPVPRLILTVLPTLPARVHVWPSCYLQDTEELYLGHP